MEIFGKRLIALAKAKNLSIPVNETLYSLLELKNKYKWKRNYYKWKRNYFRSPFSLGEIILKSYLISLNILALMKALVKCFLSFFFKLWYNLFWDLEECVWIEEI